MASTLAESKLVRLNANAAAPDTMIARLRIRHTELPAPLFGRTFIRFVLRLLDGHKSRNHMANLVGE